jgi:arabinose-5-phosphate isomerase
MREAVLEISRKGFGCVAVVSDGGLLQGIVTDGDLRRHMGPDLLSMTVDEVMTRNPKTVSADTLAATALQLVNASAITVVMVVEDGRPVGVVHLHDLLRIGAA